MLTRQKVILVLLAKLGRPVGKTVLVKLAFLLRNETIMRSDSTFYDFLPYKYGPFSFCLYRELAALEAFGCVSTSEETVALTNHAETMKDAFLIDPSKRLFEAVTQIYEKYGRHTTNELLKNIYSRYPWYASKSELKDLAAANAVSSTAAPAVYTMGYEGKSVDGFFNALLLSGIRVLLDVRANPVSRKYGFAKSSLGGIAEKLGLAYHNLPELGIPSEARTNLPDFSSRRRLFDVYEKDMLPKNAPALERLVVLLKEAPSVLVCMEKDVSCCHRGRLALVASRKSGLPIIHL